MDEDRNGEHDAVSEAAAFDGLMLRVTRQTLIVLCGFMASVLGTNFVTWSTVDSRRADEFEKLQQAIIAQDQKREALHETLNQHIRQENEMEVSLRELQMQLGSHGRR